MTKCSHCWGEGKIEVHTDDDIEEFETCLMCNGTGEEDD